MKRESITSEEVKSLLVCRFDANLKTIMNFWTVVSMRIEIPNAVPRIFFVGYSFQEPPLGVYESIPSALEVMCQRLAKVLKEPKKEGQSFSSVDDLGDDLISMTVNMVKEKVPQLTQQDEEILRKIVKDLLQNFLNHLVRWVPEGEDFYDSYWQFIETAYEINQGSVANLSPQAYSEVLKKMMSRDQCADLLKRVMGIDFLAAEEIVDKIPAVGSYINDFVNLFLCGLRIAHSTRNALEEFDSEGEEQKEREKVLKEISDKTIVAFDEVVEMILEQIYRT